MEHKWLRLFKNGVWTGREDRKVIFKGAEHSIDDLAKEYDLDLPDAKPMKKEQKQINKIVDDLQNDIKVKEYEDMGKSQQDGDTE